MAGIKLTNVENYIYNYMINEYTNHDETSNDIGNASNYYTSIYTIIDIRLSSMHYTINDYTITDCTSNEYIH